jgi:protocatechuate 3,4-dioxygenase beta subunit
MSARRVLALSAGLSVLAAASAGAPALAERGDSPAEAEPSPASNCPMPNPPNQLTLVAGTPQTTTLETAFASGLQVALTNSDGCAVSGAAGVAVTFSAPAAGASGLFSANNASTVTVGADAAGGAAAPPFTANGTAGSYTVTASSPYGSISFSLTNTAAGIPARLVAIAPQRRSARVGARYAKPLQVRVLDAAGKPVAGSSVTFVLGSGAGICGSGAAPGASFAEGGTQAGATTDAAGLATSPALIADGAAGSFTATATAANDGGNATEGAAKGGSPTVSPVAFSLANLAGKPAKIAPGVGSTQTTPAGSAFPIGLAVTVTDAEKNPVAGALVTFSAPAAGADGRFTLRSHGARRQDARISYARAVAIKTGACGIAVAPPFSAGREPGGYIVKASAKPARPAAFALVNEAP